MPTPSARPIRSAWPAPLGLLAAVLSAGAGEPLRLPDLTVSANRYEQPAAEVPAAVSVWEAEEWRARPALSLAEVLADLPGVLVRSLSGSPADGEIILRGFASAPGQRVLVRLDGLTLNRPDLRGLNWARIPLSQIARVEVLRGSHTALYGNHAVGGVVNLTSRPPSAAGSGEADLQFGSDGLRQGSLTASAGAAGWGAADSLEAWEWDGHRANSAARSRSASLTVSSPADRRWQMRGRLQADATDQRWPGPLDEASYRADPRQSLLPGQDSAEQSASGSARLSWTPAPDRSGEVQAAFDRQDISWNMSGTHADNLHTTFQLTPQWVWSNEASRGTLGLDLAGDQLDFTRYASRRREAALGTARLRRAAQGLFAHGTWRPAQPWSLSAGLRQEWYRLYFARVDYDPFDPDPEAPISRYSGNRRDQGRALNLGLTWQPSPGAPRLWARADRLYRYPATDEIAAYQGYELTEPFNADLGPERGWNTEVGGEFRRGPWSAEAGLFWQEMEGEIEFVRGQGLNLNLPPTRRRGAEAGLGWDRAPWRLRLDYSWTEATVRAGPWAGRDRFLVPPHQLKLSASWRLSPGRLVGLRWSWVAAAWEGDDFANARPRLPAHATADAFAAWSLDRHWTVRGEVRNLGDTRYAESKYLGQWYPAPGRTWRLALGYVF